MIFSTLSWYLPQNEHFTSSNLIVLFSLNIFKPLFPSPFLLPPARQPNRKRRTLGQ